MSSSVQIGVARADITPPVGIPMVGFAGRGPSNQVHDPLYATALVVSEGSQTAALICADLLQLGAETVAEFRQAIEAATGIPASHITLACAHNHYGPDVDRSPDNALVTAYRANLCYQFAGIVAEGLQKLRPARMGIGWGSSDIGINRREKRPDGVIVLGNNPDGPVDREVGVARFDGADGRPLATLVNFACHPVSQGGQMRALSGDFPGKAREVVEMLTGAPCLYLQGACGNINPIRMEFSYEPARTLGTRLGCEVVRVWETVAPQEISGVKVVGQSVALPRYRYGSQEQAAQLAEELDGQIARLEAQNAASGSLWWAKLRRKRIGEALESWRTGTPLPEVTTELQAWRLGPLAFATAPGEIFTENGQLVKQTSPHDATFFGGYTNGSIGYVPTRSAYPEGGYEVTHACQVDPDAGEMVNAGCVALLEQLS